MPVSLASITMRYRELHPRMVSLPVRLAPKYASWITVSTVCLFKIELKHTDRLACTSSTYNTATLVCYTVRSPGTFRTGAYDVTLKNEACESSTNAAARKSFDAYSRTEADTLARSFFPTGHLL